MELWWFISPLFETGVACLGIALIVILLAYAWHIENVVPLVLFAILCIPLAACGVLAVINVIYLVFYNIWSPYI